MLQEDCIAVFNGDSAKTKRVKCYQNYFQNLAKPDQDDLLYDMLLKMSKLPGSRSGIIPWTFAERRICRRAWKALLGIGSHRLSRMVTQLKTGLRVAPTDSLVLE